VGGRKEEGVGGREKGGGREGGVGGGRKEGEGGRRGGGIKVMVCTYTSHWQGPCICSVLDCILCVAVCGGGEVAKMCTRCGGGRDRDRRGEEGRDGDRRGEDCVPHAV